MIQQVRIYEYPASVNIKLACKRSILINYMLWYSFFTGVPGAVVVVIVW